MQNSPLETDAIILRDSINEFGHRLTTFQLTYHRYILAELNTHRVFSRNSASSRAIPINSQIDYVINNTAYPPLWGKNKKGMQSEEELTLQEQQKAIEIWNNSRNNAINSLKELNDLNIHKQIGNRLLEPYVYIQTILTSTDFNNFFNLRYHKDAAPEINKLAKIMYDKYHNSIPKQIQYNQWHLPYVNLVDNGDYYLNDTKLSIKDAIKISISCVAQISYRKLDFSLEKANDIYDKLVKTYPIHASPLEHIATPFSHKEFNIRKEFINKFKESIDTEVDINNEIDIEHFMYKRNFKGWTQYRTGIPNETKLD